MVLVEDLVDRTFDVTVREVDDHVLVAAAFRVGLASGLTCDIAPDRSNLFQLPVRPVDPQLALQNKGPVRRRVSMQRDPLVRCELEQQVDDPGFLIDTQDMIGGVIEAFDRPPDDVAVIECERCHGVLLMDHVLADAQDD